MLNEILEHKIYRQTAVAKHTRIFKQINHLSPPPSSLSYFILLFQEQKRHKKKKQEGIRHLLWGGL
jgi:hypothetical protein